MPEAVTVPVPVPDTLTVRVWLPGGLKVAIQDRAPVMLTTPSEQSLSPDQPPNVEPLVGLGVKVTLVL